MIIRDHLSDKGVFHMPERKERKRKYAIPGLYEHQGRYALLYDDRYLRMFSTEKCKELSPAQQRALKDMDRLVGDLTEQFRHLFLKMARIRPAPGNRSSDEDDLSELSVDMIAFRIVYPFWNRMNSTPERYEVGFAKSGELGKYLRALKEKDEVLL